MRDAACTTPAKTVQTALKAATAAADAAAVSQPSQRLMIDRLIETDSGRRRGVLPEGRCFVLTSI
jgi:hypothetical protein